MVNFQSLIERIGAANIATGAGVKYPTVAGWKRRGSIPPEYWPGVIAAASKAGLRLTEANLARIAITAPKRKRAA